MTKVPWKQQKKSGMNHLCEGLSSALTKPNECVPAGTVRQTIKRMLMMIAGVVIYQNKSECVPVRTNDNKLTLSSLEYTNNQSG